MDEAIAVLREAVRRGQDAKQTGADVRLALKALRFVGIPAEAIRYFWDACQSDYDVSRSQSMMAALNRIELFRSGKLPVASKAP
jgi:hypothetical protein